MFGNGKNNSHPRQNFKRRREEGLKNGCGTITIYTAIMPHKNSDVYEWGYLKIPHGASIGIHTHYDECESWEVVKGIVNYYENEKCEVVNCLSGERICCKGNSHGLTNFGGSTAIIKFQKF